jgi:hypothetical protein
MAKNRKATPLTKACAGRTTSKVPRDIGEIILVWSGFSGFAYWISKLVDKMSLYIHYHNSFQSHIRTSNEERKKEKKSFSHHHEFEQRSSPGD